MAQLSVFRGMLERLAPRPLPAPVTGALGKILQLDSLDRFYAQAVNRHTSVHFAGLVLNALNARVKVTSTDLQKIPRSGPLVVVANHPFGLIEAAALDATLRGVRPDIRFLANGLLAAIPELANHVIPVDPFGGAEATLANRRGLREALRWLESGGALAVFPAGEVAHLDLRRRQVLDPPWNAAAARLARQTNAKVLPVHFTGANGPLFQVAGLVHPRIRTALLPHELLNKRNRTIEMRIGHPCAPLPIDQLRRRSDWLKLRRAQPLRPPLRRMAAIGPAIPTDWVAGELAQLPADRLLVASGNSEVWLARAAEIPMTLREIGRLREIAFRLAGEGSGHAYDLDRFDESYLHLILWSRELRSIQGAYRFAESANRPLYTTTLFRFSPEFFHRLGPALELGRSFIRPEAQRSFQPLLLLWRGIGEYLARNPATRRLFGPVSISAAYRPASRGLIARYLAAHHFNPALAAYAAPRKPFTLRPAAPWPGPVSLEDLDRLVRDIEPDAKGIPVLLRQYLKLNGRICAFNLDPAFGNCLDALIVVDLDSAPREHLARYLRPPDRANPLTL